MMIEKNITENIACKYALQFILLFVSLILFILLLPAFTGQIPNLFQELNSVENVKSINNKEFAFKNISNFFIAPQCNTMLNGDLLNDDKIDGCRGLTISPEKDVFFNLYLSSIASLRVRNNIKIKLHGHLRILRKIRLSGESEIVLNDFNLILSSVVTLDNVALQKILANGTGRTVHIQDTDLLPIRNNIQHTSSTIDIHSLVAGSIITFPPMYVCSAYYFAERDFNIFREIDSPPPKKIVLS
jgi:hypothetical protein